MNKGFQGWSAAAAACMLLFGCSQEKAKTSVTVPMALDHNRMLVDAEIRREDGSWRGARLWIDTGNPDFYLREALARDLGFDLTASGADTDVPPPGVRIGGMPLDFDGVPARILSEPHWLFDAMHNDGNLPSTVLRKYHVVFDYPGRRLTIAEPGTRRPRGERLSARIHPRTGIPQIGAVVDGDSLSFAVDLGASYSFVSQEVYESLLREHPGYPRILGTTGCANMWGWWPPNEHTMPVFRIPELWCGPVRLTGLAMVGVSEVFENGPGLGTWYSQKTAGPVVGFLGPNAFRAFRVEIDYRNSAIYLDKSGVPDPHDMDLVGLTLRPEEDGSYRLLGVASGDGKPLVEGVEPGDLLRRVDGLETTGATFGTVMDALRGEPGDTRILELERDGNRFRVEAIVTRVL